MKSSQIYKIAKKEEEEEKERDAKKTKKRTPESLVVICIKHVRTQFDVT